MRNLLQRSSGLAICAVLLFSLVAASCGQVARDHELTPAIGKLWPDVRLGVAAGIAATDSVDEAQEIRRLEQWDAAIADGDRNALIAVRNRDWQAFKGWAGVGIAEREAAGLSPGVAESLRERTRQFDRMLGLLDMPAPDSTATQ